jgi:hypothetical protein
MSFNCDITVATNVWPLLDCSINGDPNWVKIVIKTTLGEKDSQISLKTECPVVTRDEIFNVIHKCHLRTEWSSNSLSPTMNLEMITIHEAS